MKAKIILNLCLSSKSTIGYENFLKKDEFQNFLLRFSKKKNFECKFFKISFSIPLRFYFGTIINTKNETYMKDQMISFLLEFINKSTCWKEF